MFWSYLIGQISRRPSWTSKIQSNHSVSHRLGKLLLLNSIHPLKSVSSNAINIVEDNHYYILLQTNHYKLTPTGLHSRPIRESRPVTSQINNWWHLLVKVLCSTRPSANAVNEWVTFDVDGQMIIIKESMTRHDGFQLRARKKYLEDLNFYPGI